MRAQMPKLPSCAATVTQIEELGPAAQAGVRPDDIVLEINGRQPRNLDHLREALTDCAPGKKSKLKVLRAGKELELRIKPVATGPRPPKGPRPPTAKK